LSLVVRTSSAADKVAAGSVKSPLLRLRAMPTTRVSRLGRLVLDGQMLEEFGYRPRRWKRSQLRKSLMFSGLPSPVAR
jgi:hypothetical protein